MEVDGEQPPPTVCCLFQWRHVKGLEGARGFRWEEGRWGGGVIMPEPSHPGFAPHFVGPALALSGGCQTGSLGNQF